MQNDYTSLKFKGEISGKFIPGLTNTTLKVTASRPISRSGIYSVTQNYISEILPELTIISDVRRDGCTYFNRETPKTGLFTLAHKAEEHIDEFIFKAVIRNLQKPPINWGKQHSVNVGVKMYAAALGIQLK